MKENYLGIDVSSYSYKNLMTHVVEDINEDKQSFIVAINPEKILTAQQDNNLMRLLNQATYQIPDGVGILIASRIKKGNIRERVTGIDMLEALCEMASVNGKSIFLYGAKPGVADQAKFNLIKKFPSLKVAGVLDGYEKDQELIKNTINMAQPDILFVALGSPTQEYWIVDNMEDLNVNIFQGVGGSFDVLSGRTKRAPKFFQKIGLEWFYRLMKEPYRIKRQLKLPLFLLKVWKTK
ncbi:glycosyltransferase [Virgibacillus profundi]|uniref:N-acetylglucosaminyldiphosphoundecaprenol N-acetyl-beta-D-mannosaminyltransferase n=1 Tax=Virgibacillus profundi TaxID=2024555 RepID=A0A2A2II62_9BACI|nr:WecB/TagA/CpsF family glycosyltransferase [Virgibacillus profundi]PAV31307.1 glycosyltransferase [Virgibacillus profundi]PXY55492.1 glycosyltransferase [Virgibacillus profundi]